MQQLQHQKWISRYISPSMALLRGISIQVVIFDQRRGQAQFESKSNGNSSMRNQNSQTVSLGAAETQELPQILALLEKCDLPKEGLSDHFPTILVARNGKEIVGSSGLEVYQEFAMLRSVAVDPSFRGRGIGQRLVIATIDLAKNHQVTNIYLLTQTASAFFSKLGFKAIPRADVPQKVQRSIQFTTLCPDTSIIMTISL